MNYKKMATALGWFSIGLGMAEIIVTGKLGRALGMENRKGLLRAYGIREVATGIGILTQREQASWLWARVGGDLLDVATLAPSFKGTGSKRGPGLAAAAVAGATALDIVCSRGLTALNRGAAKLHQA